MTKIKDLVMVNDYCARFNLSALHPLVSVVDVSEGIWKEQKKVEAIRYNFYAVFLKQGQQCILRYGRKNYDYQDGTLVFVGPGQVVNITNIDPNYKPSGYALLFHPDLFRGKTFSSSMEKYSFFSYELHLSPNYFGDLVKKETGKSAQEYIQAKLIEVAKEKIFDPEKSVSEIAYQLGFKYPQHFTRFFKNKAGYTPNEYRKLN